MTRIRRATLDIVSHFRALDKANRKIRRFLFVSRQDSFANDNARAGPEPVARAEFLQFAI
jgi:hypothetical protein